MPIAIPSTATQTRTVAPLSKTRPRSGTLPKTTTSKATQPPSTSRPLPANTRRNVAPSSTKPSKSNVEEMADRMEGLGVQADSLTRDGTRPCPQPTLTKPASAKPKPVARPASEVLSVDELATQVSNRLQLDENVAIAKGEQSSPTSSQEAASAALKALRATYQRLSDAVQLGWKCSAPTKDYTIKTLRASIASADKSIRVLRDSSFARSIDIERTVSHLTGRLISLELFEEAERLLASSQPRLLTLYEHRASEAVSAAASSVFSLPLPDESTLVQETLASLIGAFHLYGAQVVIHRESENAVEALLRFPNILDWHPWIAQSLPDQQCSALMTSAFQAVAKCHAPISPGVLFELRSWGLRCLVRSSSLKADPFWDQAGKYSASYVKVSGNVVRDAVVGLLDTLFELAAAREDGDAFLRGRGFISICEYRLKFARASRHTGDIDRIKRLLERSARSASADSRINERVDWDHRVAELSASLAQPISIVDQLQSIPEADFGALRVAPLTIDDCCHFLQEPDIPTGHRDRILLELERLQVTCTRLLANESLASSGNDSQMLEHADSQPTTPTHRQINGDINSRPGFLVAVSKLLESVLSCLVKTLSVADLSANGKQSKSIVESYIVLARASLSQPIRLPSRETYDHLHDAVKFVEHLPLSSPVLAECGRLLSLVHWTFGTALYGNDQIAAAVPYLEVSCRVGEQALRMLQLGATPQTSPEIRTLEDQISKRWELLGFCEARTGDFRAAREAYVRGLVASQECIRRLGRAASSTSSSPKLRTEPSFVNLFSLVERYTFVLTFDLLIHQLVSVRHVFEHLDDGDDEISGVAYLVEHQCRYLSTSAGSRTPEARSALKHLLDDAVIFYRGDLYPIRRARVLLRTLEERYFEDNQDAVVELAQEIRDLVCDPQDPDEVDRHISRLSATHDIGLIALRPLLLATTHMWTALSAHRALPDNEVSEAIQHRASRALKMVQTAYLETQAVQNPTLKLVATKASKRVLPATKNKATKAKPTPGARGRMAKASPTENASLPDLPISGALFKAVRPQSHPDEFEAFVGLLDTVSCIAGMLGLQLLKFEILQMRFALHRLDDSDCLSDDFVLLCVDLARDYVSLGRFDLAGVNFAEALAVLDKPDQNVSPEARIALYLSYAAATVAGGNLEQGLAAYAESAALANMLSASREVKGLGKAFRVIQSMIRAAKASHTFSLIQQDRYDSVAALRGHMQSLRLWNRATHMLAKLNKLETKIATKASPKGSPNPFLVDEPKEEANVPVQTHVLTAIQWKVTEGALTTLFAISRVYYDRGSAKESEYFLEQARSLSASVRALGLQARSCIRLAELKMLCGNYDFAEGLLAESPPSIEPNEDRVDMLRITAGLKLRLEDVTSAQILFTDASCVLNLIARSFGEIEKRTKRIDIKASDHLTLATGLLPSMAAAIWRQLIWLLREAPEDGSEYSTLLDKFVSLPSSLQIKAEENILMGNLSLNEVFARFKADIVLSALPESTLAIPLGMHGGDVVTPPTATRELLNALSAAEKFFWLCLELPRSIVGISFVREASISLSLIRAFQTALGAKSKNSATVSASLIDLSIFPTLKQELLQCIDDKFDSSVSDDLLWQNMSVTGSPVRPSTVRKGALVFTDSDDDIDESSEISNSSLKTYWGIVRDRLKSEACDAMSLATSHVDSLPHHWTVVSISVTQDRSTLIVSRRRPSHKPLIVYLPLSRQDRRDDSDQDKFTWEMAKEELSSIIAASDETSKNARAAIETEHRRAWWAERSMLDERLKTFLENVEYCWLGVFKTILAQPISSTPDLCAAFRSKLESALRRNGCMHDKRNKQHLHLDDTLLECFATLSPKCRDEELEDLAYFVLDLFQLHGAQVAVSEIDVDQLAVDLRTVLEEHATALNRAHVQPVLDHHIFLVLDKNVQGIPWESIPVLRRNSVSRIPNLSFLIDRVQMARHLRGLSPFPDPVEIASSTIMVDRASVDPRRTFYILNPSGDLQPTQERFQDWVKGMQRVGWDGIVGRVPSEDELIRALTTYDLVIYFGHGGGEQYIRSHKIRNLPRCASMMLWGCSSGALREMGELDRVGTPLHYMVAGSPCFVANLWDVTDKDIDRLSDNVFTKLRLNESAVRSWSPLLPAPPTSSSTGINGGTVGHRRTGSRVQLVSPTKSRSVVSRIPSDESASSAGFTGPVTRLIRGEPAENDEGKIGPISIVSAVAQSRDSCKLPYLTGAAPVVYGIPFYL